ncbi:MAG: LysR family transcriptional regulator [Xanthobacteraceae bacterium]
MAAVAPLDRAERFARRLKLRDLQLLDTVVRWGNMAKAAEQLHLSQPAVSKAIAEMEHALGARLLNRGRQGVQATPQGLILLQRSLAIHDELRQGLAEITNLADPSAGEVRVASPEPIAAGILTELIARFTRKYPRAAVTITQTPVASLHLLSPRYHDLRERRVDMMLAPTFGGLAESDLQTEKLFDDPSVIAASAGSPWLRRRDLRLADLLDEPWVLQPPDTIAGQTHAEAFEAEGLTAPANTIRSDAVHVQLGLAATRRYLTILPRSLLHFAAKRLLLRPLKVTLKVRPYALSIVTLRRRTVAPAVQAFIAMTRELAGSIRFSD